MRQLSSDDEKFYPRHFKECYEENTVNTITILSKSLNFDLTAEKISMKPQFRKDEVRYSLIVSFTN